MALSIQPAEFWYGVLVNHALLEQKWAQEVLRDRLRNYLMGIYGDNLAHIGGLSGVPVDATQYTFQMADQLAGSEAGFTLGCLKEFADGRHRAIDLYWMYSQRRSPSSVETLAPYAKLVILYDDNPQHLDQINVLHHWLIRASGNVYTANTYVKLQDPPEFGEGIAATVARKTKTAVKLVGTCGTPDGGTIFLLHRQDPEKLLGAYHEPVRFVGAQSVVFRVSPGAVSTLEVKSDLQRLEAELIAAACADLSALWTERPDAPFDNYSQDEIREVFQQGGVDRSLRVVAMEFGNVPLASPQTSLVLSSADDVADSVAALRDFSMDLIQIQSLKDVRKIRVQIPGEDRERAIEPVEINSSEIKFVLDDRKLLPETVQDIARKFQLRFKLPLGLPIDHSKFGAGRARLIDYLFAADYQENVPEYQIPTLDALLRRGLITSDSVQELECRDCRVVAKNATQTHCSVCHQPLQPGRPVTNLVHPTDLADLVADILAQVPGWKAIRKGHKVTMCGEQYAVFTLKRTEPLVTGIDKKAVPPAELLVHVTSTLPSEDTVRRFQRHQEPLFIVYVGKAATGRQRDRLAKLHGDTLGELLAKEETGQLAALGPSLAEALAAGGTRLRSAVEAARERVRLVINNQRPPGYTDVDFEDDVWALLRSLGPTVVKWGADKLKRAVPDGFMDFDYQIPPDEWMIRAWSYDAKLTEMEEGYDLGQAERRKVHEYVVAAAVSRRLYDYTNRDGFTGHLLISNRFKPTDIPRIGEYLHKHDRKRMGKVKVRFLDVDALLHLSLISDLFADEISKRSNIFLEQLDALLMADDPHVTLQDVEEMVAKVLSEKPERGDLEYDEVADEISK